MGHLDRIFYVNGIEVKFTLLGGVMIKTGDKARSDSIYKYLQNEGIIPVRETSEKQLTN